MILRQSPVVQSVIGFDAPRGWLPQGAAAPLPEPPTPAWLDVRICSAPNGYRLAWHSHVPQPGRPESSVGDRTYSALQEAEQAATDLFGLRAADWVYRSTGGPPDQVAVAALRDQVLTAHDVDLALPVEGLLVVPPRLVPFEITGHDPAECWLVLDAPAGEGYAVFYDPDDGSYGLGSTVGRAVPTYIGHYGSLWTTLLAL